MKEKKTIKWSGRNTLLILGTVYALISILAIVSYISKMNSISTTPITIGNVLGAIWWQLIMILLFGVSYVMYTKKQIFGILLEIVMGIAMLVYIVITVVSMGINVLALIIELVYPSILIVHGLIGLKKTNRETKKERTTRMSTI